MAKNIDPKCKQCRREGKKLMLKGDRCNSSKCAMVKRNFPPGVHGSKGYPRQTGYGIQLREKQKVKRMYNLMEKQFKNYFIKASNQKGNTEEILFQLLEMRLDNVVFRMGLVPSRVQARQVVNHGHILVNGKKLNIPSYQLKVGDEISVREKSKKSKLLEKSSELIKNAEPVSWLSTDPKELEVKVTDRPGEKEMKGQFDLKLIIEFYSK